MKKFQNHMQSLGLAGIDIGIAVLPDRRDLLAWLSVMQHYDVPTRLLDWTSNFWVAVYFACASEPDQDGELYFLDRNVFDYKTGGVKLTAEEKRFTLSFDSTATAMKLEPRVVLYDPRSTPRMLVQAGHHTVCSRPFGDHLPYLVTRQQDAVQGGSRAMFRRVVIDRRCKKKLLDHLVDAEDVHAGTLFPDVAGIGKYLQWQLDSFNTRLHAED